VAAGRLSERLRKDEGTHEGTDEGPAP
jgi:hypothetical protein